MLLVEAGFGADTTTTLGFVITLVVLGGGIAAGILTSRLLQGRSLRDLEEWRKDEADPQLDTLMKEHNYQTRREQERLSESSSQSAVDGVTQPYKKSNR